MLPNSSSLSLFRLFRFFRNIFGVNSTDGDLDVKPKLVVDGIPDADAAALIPPLLFTSYSAPSTFGLAVVENCWGWGSRAFSQICATEGTASTFAESGALSLLLFAFRPRRTFPVLFPLVFTVVVAAVVVGGTAGPKTAISRAHDEPAVLSTMLLPLLLLTSGGMPKYIWGCCSIATFCCW